MNRLLHINLGGYPLNMDEDAFEYLEKYLGGIRTKFSASEGCDEILHDIESRMGELITMNMGKRTIVMLPDVEAVVQIMGKPEDFDTEGSDSSTSTRAEERRSYSSIKTGKRFFRDEEDVFVGGVCSGLAAYFGMQDPLWMRLIFVGLFFISAGFWVPVYILLMILVPSAKTAADRLAMRGEPVNVDNIAREIQEGFEKLGQKVNEMSENGKKKSTSYSSGKPSFNNTLSRGIAVLGKLFGIFIQFIVKFGGLIALLVGIVLLLALVISWAASIWSVFSWTPYLEFLSPLGKSSTYMWIVNLFLVVSIPIVGFFTLLMRGLFKYRAPAWISWALAIGWVFNFFLLITYSLMGVNHFKSKESITKTTELTDLSSDTLRVFATDIYDDDESWTPFARWHHTKLAVHIPIHIRVRKSTDSTFRLIQVTSAHGKKPADALTHATQVNFEVGKSGNVMFVPRYIYLEKGQKWHNPRVRMYVEMPVGKHIVFDKNIYRDAVADLDDYAHDNGKHYLSRSPGHVFKMTDAGLICVDCHD